MNATAKTTRIENIAPVAFFAVESPGGILPCNIRPGTWLGCGVTIKKNNGSVHFGERVDKLFSFTPVSLCFLYKADKPRNCRMA